MNRTAALVSVAGLFLVGVLVGGLGTHLFYAEHFDSPRESAAERSQRFIERLEDDLDLTADQRQQIDAIIRESRQEGDAIREEMLPRVRAHMERTRERIREVLTPEQQAKFDELHRHDRRHWEHFVLGHGRRHRPPPPTDQ